MGEVQRGLQGVQGGLRELAHASDALGRTLRGLADGTIRLPSIDAVEERTDELGRRVLRRLDGVEQSLAAAVTDQQAWLRAGLPPELAAKAQTAIVASLEPLERALHDRLGESANAMASGIAEQLKETEEAVVQRLQEECRAEQRSMSRRLESRLDVLTQELTEQGGLGGRLNPVGGQIEALLKAEKATDLKLTGIRDRLADACSTLESLSDVSGPADPGSAELIETNQQVVERLDELTREIQTVRRRLPVRGRLPGSGPAAPIDEGENLPSLVEPGGEPSLPGSPAGAQEPPGRRAGEPEPPPVPRRRPGSSVKLGSGVPARTARDSSR